MDEEFLLKPFGDARAGKYVGGLFTPAKGLIYRNGSAFGFGGIRTLIDAEVTLLDISFYQDTADFVKMISASVEGVIIRAGQNLWADSRAEIFMSNAESAKMPIGSYWYYDSRADPKEQAKKWKSVLGNHKTPLYCWADYEETYDGDYHGWRYFYDFLEACRTEMPDRKFGIYTGYYYWIDHSPNPITQSANLNYFAQYPLWLAWYTTDMSIVKIPKPWTKLLFWQYTSSGNGTTYGVGSREVDKNKFNGNIEEFYKQFGIENGGTQPMPEITYEGTVKSTITLGAIVRDAPAGNAIGTKLAAGTAIQGTGSLVAATLNGVNYNWMNIISPVNGWVADSLLDYHLADQPVPTQEITVDVVARDVYVQGDIYAARGIKLTKEA